MRAIFASNTTQQNTTEPRLARRYPRKQLVHAAFEKYLIPGKSTETYEYIFFFCMTMYQSTFTMNAVHRLELHDNVLQ